MSSGDVQPDELADLVNSGDRAGIHDLMCRYRSRLKRMIAVRMAPLLSARIDASDVVQEALVEAAVRLPEYLSEPPLPFYPWLRQIAWERLVDLHHHHIDRKKRSVVREERGVLDLPDLSASQLAAQLIGKTTSPGDRLIRKELRNRVHGALDQLDADDREILVLRHLEQMKVSEIAALLDISESGVKMRRLRAVARLRDLLGDDFSEPGR